MHATPRCIGFARASAAVVLLALVAGAWLLFAPRTPGAVAQAAPPDAETRALFLADCAVCHGADARGTDRGPSLASSGRAGMDYVLSTGRMPLVDAGRTNEPGRPIRPLPESALGDPDDTPARREPAYPPATIRALVDYVAELTGGEGPDIPRVGDGDVARGGELFRLQCAACHAWAGDGGALLDREAPSVHPATSLQVAEAVRVGPGQMPAFGEAALTDEQLDAVVAYVRYLDDPRDRGGTPLDHLGPVAEGAVALAVVAGLLLLTRWIGERG